MQSDDLGLAAKLLDLISSDDHERLCQGREYSCSCGYDERKDAALAEAAAAIERLVAAPEKLREVLRQILRCEYDGHGLNDCIDNDGVPYQSAFLANCIAEAENLVSESARQALKDTP